jgi:hypothetical protein
MRFPLSVFQNFAYRYIVHVNSANVNPPAGQYLVSICGAFVGIRLPDNI